MLLCFFTIDADNVTFVKVNREFEFLKTDYEGDYTPKRSVERLML